MTSRTQGNSHAFWLKAVFVTEDTGQQSDGEVPWASSLGRVVEPQHPGWAHCTECPPNLVLLDPEGTSLCVHDWSLTILDHFDPWDCPFLEFWGWGWTLNPPRRQLVTWPWTPHLETIMTLTTSTFWEEILAAITQAVSRGLGVLCQILPALRNSWR